MATTPFSARGAVDLGALATAKQNQAKAEQALANAPAGVVVDITAETFQAEVIDRSRLVPVVIDLWATWCEPCKQLSPILEKLAAEGGGRWVLAKVDVDAEQQIAAAFQVQSIPSVFAVIAGQPVPLFQGAYPEAQVRQIIDELLKVAEQQGVSGTLGADSADAAAGETADEAAEEAVDPRFEPAYAAIEAGDWDAAERAYRAVLDSTPSDADAEVGLAVVRLYRRTDGLTDVAEPTPGDAASLLAAADAAALVGEWAVALGWGIDAVRASSGDDKDAARARVLDYFLLAGDDPAVPPARRSLAAALF
jgi:putative thioredoxin